MVIDWSIRLQNGKLITKRTQARTIAEVQRRAKDKAAALLQASGASQWKLTDDLGLYIDQVSKPKIEDSPLRPSSQKRYIAVLRLLQGMTWAPNRKTYAACPDHTHAASLKGHTISSGMKFRVLERALQDIALTHGPESAHQARSVLSKYVVQQLIRDELIIGNPLAGVDLDLRGEYRGSGGKRSTGTALSLAQYRQVLDHLLSMDPAEGVKGPARGRWTIADAVAKRARVINLTLLQAATGLRIGEATSLTWQDVEIDDDGQVFVTISDVVSKTHRGRRVPVLDSRVAARFGTQKVRAEDITNFVIGSPTDSSKVWEQRNRDHAVAALYVELAESLELEVLTSVRSHVWRATLNSLLLDLPEAQRAAFFGHGPAANRQHYTDVTDVTPMIAAANRLRAPRR